MIKNVRLIRIEPDWNVNEFKEWAYNFKKKLE